MSAEFPPLRATGSESDRRFEALLLASAAIVWWTNADGEFVEPQPYWEAYTGQAWADYGGARWISAVHPDDRAAIAADWAAAVGAGSPYFTQGRLFSAQHGGYRAFQTRGIPIKDGDGRIQEWLGALTDIQDTIDMKALLTRTETELAASLQALRTSAAPAWRSCRRPKPAWPERRGRFGG